MKKIAIILAALALQISAAAGEPQNLRLLYWNIQNGMWADQGNNYDAFVEYVNYINPDICVWCEAKTHYKTNSPVSFKETDDLYLPAYWNELAARYGHNYVYVGGERDFFPQVITSRYPIENVERMVGDDNVVISRGAGWAKINVGGRDINIVTMHTWPQKYNFGLREKSREEQRESEARAEGDRYRAKEVEWVCNHTINSVKKAKKQLWMMMGDMNSRSRRDNAKYGWPEDSPKFLAQDYSAHHTPYVDVVFKWFGPKDLQYTHANKHRIDYVYCTPALYKMVSGVEVIHTGFPANHKVTGPAAKKRFYYPSDHFPILVDFKIK
ncbi:MAG: endonuclease [Bacteroidales bacterium]|nr:endonuclease [Bacteroidales bacterium]